MSKRIFFTPGPTHLYPTVDKHINDALDQQLLSVSHRSAAFHKVYRETDENLRELLGLPSDFYTCFTGSATEIWERFLLSCVQSKSTHFTNGSFSNRFHAFAEQIKLNTQQYKADFGKGFSGDYLIDHDSEAICFTSNETSSGVYTQEQLMHSIKSANSSKLVAVDAVSAVPYPKFDYTKIDSVLFSVQKAFGLPAGLGVWIYNEKCLAKAEEKLSISEAFSGTYHNLVNIHKNVIKYETACTPNILGVYVLGKVAKDLLNIGIEQVRREFNEKSAKLYHFAESTDLLDPFVKEKSHRSPSVIVCNTKSNSIEINSYLKELDMQVGTGYKDYKEKQIRIANFPAISNENIEKLIEALKKY